MKLINIKGNRYGSLVAIRKSPLEKRWVFVCDCGKSTNAFLGNVLAGRTRSCGCGRFKTHGMSKTAEYKVWESMIKRCTKPTSDNFCRYGGRGIAVCKRWRKFENFFSDMGRRPSSQFSIERIDNNGNYSPDNCKWATKEEQYRNMRTNHFVDYGGEKMIVADAAKLAGLKYGTVAARLSRGWSVERAFSKLSFERRSGMIKREARSAV